MITEYLNFHPLRDLLMMDALAPDWPAPSPGDRAALTRLIEQYQSEPYAQLTASQYMAFARTGDRAIMEKPYFQRRRKLIAALMGNLVGEMSDEAMDSVVDGLWLICEETSWVISAHNGAEHAGVEPTPPKPLPDPDQPYVDLFAAQTAMVLSITCQLLADQLDAVAPILRRRVKNEVERRVLRPFEARDDFWWMGFIRHDLCNWTPWIVSNVMLTACIWIEDRDRLAALLTRGCGMLDRYLDTLPADGGCDEGVGYWSMAGGAVLDCLELLERVTGGRLAFWSDQKLKDIMRFPLNLWLGGRWFANFGDCDARPGVPGERLQRAGQKLGDPALVAFGARFRGDPAAAIADTPQLWRLLNELRPAPKDVDEAEPPRDVWLRDLEIRVLRRGGAALACKGGVNAGSHSHNDCGSFIYFMDGEPQIVDVGNMVYTGKTFSDARYSLWHIRSAYHNVPMIGAHEQVAGVACRARDVSHTPDGLALDIAGAYPTSAGVRTLARTFALGADGTLYVRDDIALDAPLPVTEVFLLRHPPEIREGGLVSGAVRIASDQPMAINLEEIPVTDPRMAASFPGSLWRATFTARAATTHALSFTIGRNIP